MMLGCSWHLNSCLGCVQGFKLKLFTIPACKSICWEAKCGDSKFKILWWHILDIFYLKNACLPWVVIWLRSCIVHHWYPTHKSLVFSASQRPCHCGGCINLFAMNIELITWPGKIYNFKWLVMDFSECKWPKPGIKPNSADFQIIKFNL